MYRLNEQHLRNFWAKVEKTDTCWLWTGSKTWKGYGQFAVHRRTQRCHKISWQLANDTKLGPNQWILHTCDVKACVRPDHLYLGTPKDNARDAVQRGRTRKGSSHPFAKLNESKVKEIRDLLGSGLPKRLIGNRFGVSHQAIRDIANGFHWKHV